MRSHERHHLAGDLKIRHVAVEIDPVQALDIQGHVTIEKLIHRQRCSHTNRMTPTRHAKPARTSAVRGAASLADRRLNVIARPSDVHVSFQLASEPVSTFAVYAITHRR